MAEAVVTLPTAAFEAAASTSPNPWTETGSLDALSAVPNSPATSPVKYGVDATVLKEFDPLAAESHNAWTDAQGNPPQPRSVTPPPPVTTTKTEPSESLDSPPKSAPPTSATFPIFSSIAKSIAALPRAVTPGPKPATPPPARKERPVSGEIQPSPGVTNGHNRSESIESATHTAKGPALPPKEVAFDFQKFLDQMKSKGAEPVAKYLRSFLSNFSKKTFTVSDQVKLVHNFLAFIADRMRESEVWRNASDAEFDNATEAMEKLVMNRLYDYTFTPQIDRTQRTITTDDLERDLVLTQRIKLFEWIQEDHLDIPKGEGVQGFFAFAEQELLKINHYKAPRDKLICVLNCCKVIFGLIRHAKSDEGADAFLPILIFVVLKANPEHLISNVEYINRFRSASRLQSEAGYYLSSLMGAISFIETMDHKSLSNITQQEFEERVTTAIQALPQSPTPQPPAKDQPEEGASQPESSTPQPQILQPQPPAHTTQILATSTSPHEGEESARQLLLATPMMIAEDAKRFIQRTGDFATQATQTISRPLGVIGKMFSDVIDGAEERLRGSPGPPALDKDHAVISTPNAVRTAEGLQAQQARFLAQQQQQQPQYQTPYQPRIRGASPQHSLPSTPQKQAPGAPVKHQGYQQLSASQSWPAGSPSSSPFHDPQFYQQPQPQSPTPLRLHPQSQLVPPGSRSVTPSLDFSILSSEIERIDKAHRALRDANRDTLLQIFPTVDAEVAEWVLEANNSDLGRSIEALLEMNVGPVTPVPGHVQTPAKRNDSSQPPPLDDQGSSSDAPAGS